MSKQLLITTLLLFASMGASAGESTAEASESIRAKTQLVLADLSAHQQRPDAATETGMARLRNNLGDLLNPIIDIDGAAKLLLGREWKQATPEQRGRFKSALSTMLMTTYTQTLMQAGGVSIEVLDAKPATRPDRVSVPARVKLAAGREVKLVYRMRQNDGGWKIYDIVLDGISLMKTYRPAVLAALQRDGMDGLIASLEARYGSPS